jgi:hypothetical protein
VTVRVWFGHTFACGRRSVPSYRGEHALVCEQCMPEWAPRCALCGEGAPRLGVDAEGYRHHAFHYLCGACRARVLRAGDARSRRAAVTARRLETLLSHHEGLHVDEVARRRVSVRGEVDGRAVWVTLRDSSREGELERFVVRVGLAASVTLEPVAWVSALRVAPCSGSPRRVIDRGEWLWAGFRHLGNADLLHVIDVMCDAAARAERAVR